MIDYVFDEFWLSGLGMFSMGGHGMIATLRAF